MGQEASRRGLRCGCSAGPLGTGCPSPLSGVHCAPEQGRLSLSPRSTFSVCVCDGSCREGCSQPCQQGPLHRSGSGVRWSPSSAWRGLMAALPLPPQGLAFPVPSGSATSLLDGGVPWDREGRVKGRPLGLPGVALSSRGAPRGLAVLQVPALQCPHAGESGPQVVTGRPGAARPELLSSRRGRSS